MRFPCTVRLDVSDEKAFPLAAGSEEWAVTGTFAFVDIELDELSNKEKLAFSNGWLGTISFGRATFVLVAEITEAQYERVVSRLAGHIFEHYKAPDMLAALEASRGETHYTADLCDHPTGTMLAIERELTNDGVVERIRVVSKKEDAVHAKIWSIEEDVKGEK